MDEVFADSGYWIALQHPQDQLHQKANIVHQQLGSLRIVTSELVLVEFLNHMSRLGEYNRLLAFNEAVRLGNDPDVEVVSVTTQQFWEAVQYYGKYLDQRWSLVDCSSFLIMRCKGIQGALTHDRDFRSAGFSALLRDD